MYCNIIIYLIIVLCIIMIIGIILFIKWLSTVDIELCSNEDGLFIINPKQDNKD